MKKKRIAFITTGSPNNRKGFFNNVQERALRLLDAEIDDVEIDFFIIRHRDSLLFSLIRRKARPDMQSEVMIDNIKYKNLWVKHTLFDYILTIKLRQKAMMDAKYIAPHKEELKSYDLIMAHGPDANYLAYETNKSFGTPYITSWHGSDINVMPVVNIRAKALFKKIMDNAYTNLFVSKRLMQTSDNVTRNAQKEVLYTGPANAFVKQSDEQIRETKVKHGVYDKRVVGFIGNLVTIKNIKSLPGIFKNIAQYDNDIQFWIIGDGELEFQLRDGVKSIKSNCKFFGKVIPSEIPDIINAMDLLVLPSLNEGLPRVTLEALACGVPVVGSDVGGIPEVIGLNNVFSLNNDFEENISDRVIEILKNNEPAKPFPKEFSWERAMEGLERIIREVIK